MRWYNDSQKKSIAEYKNVIFILPIVSLLFTPTLALAGLPAPPTLTDVADIDPFTLEITWTEPADTSEIFGYNLYREDSPGVGFFQVNTFPVGTSLVEDGGLAPSTIYSYYVTSDGMMGESIPSNIIQGSTPSAPPPSPPTLNSVLTQSYDTVTLMWTEPPEQIDEYIVNAREIPSGTLHSFNVIAPATTATDIGLTADTTYQYNIQSVNIAGTSVISNILTITTLSAPTIEPPVLDDVATIDEQSLEIMWTEPADTSEIFGYNLYREDSPGVGFFFINSFVVGENFATDIGLLPSTTYSYYLISTGMSGDSVPSNIIVGSTSSATYVSPQIQGAILIDATTIELRWFEPADTSNIFDYFIYRDDGTGFIFHESVPVGTNSYFDLGLTSSTTYSYYIRANGISGQALPSNTVIVTTGTGTINPPTINAINPFEFSIEVQWNEPSDTTDVMQYRITRSGDNSTFFDVGFEPVGSTSFFDLGLMPNTFYMYQIYSVGGIGESVGSNIVSGITTTTQFAQAPDLFSAITDGLNTVTIFWEEPPDTSEIISYQIERRIAGVASFQPITLVPVGTTTYSEQVTPSTIFEYRLKSENSNGLGLPSNQLQVTSSIDPVQVSSIGSTIEPTATNIFISVDSQMFAQSIESFNINKTSLDEIINDIDIKRLNAYKIILRMNNQTYDSSVSMLKAGTFYGSVYISTNDLTQFIENIADRVIKANGGSNGAGDNPDFAKEAVGN